jgi:hypothetical protein
MSADTYYLLRKHPAGGFTLVRGMDSSIEWPTAHPAAESFPTIVDALKAYVDGQQYDVEDDDMLYPLYASEYGLRIHPEVFEWPPPSL